MTLITIRPTDPQQYVLHIDKKNQALKLADTLRKHYLTVRALKQQAATSSDSMSSSLVPWDAEIAERTGHRRGLHVGIWLLKMSRQSMGDPAKKTKRIGTIGLAAKAVAVEVGVAKELQFFALVNRDDSGLCEGKRIRGDEVYYFPQYRNDSYVEIRARSFGWRQIVHQTLMDDRAKPLAGAKKGKLVANTDQPGKRPVTVPSQVEKENVAEQPHPGRSTMGVPGLDPETLFTSEAKPALVEPPAVDADLIRVFKENKVHSIEDLGKALAQFKQHHAPAFDEQHPGHLGISELRDIVETSHALEIAIAKSEIKRLVLLCVRRFQRYPERRRDEHERRQILSEVIDDLRYAQTQAR